MSAQPQPPESFFSQLWHWFQLVLPGLIVAVLAFELLPTLDLQLSGLFYRPGQGFFLDQGWPVQLLYRGTRWLVVAMALALLGALGWGLLQNNPQGRRIRNGAAFALAALILGPGLIANTLLKDHWGRPRPEQIAQFGGKASYVAPLVPSRQCAHNCSFVSGHAAAGFFLITGAWLWPRRRWHWRIAGLAAGGLIGLARIAQGGHFLSDVLGALAVVWLTNELLYRWMLGRGWLEAPAAPRAAPARP
jgi:lipid A 4'-phosphatase